MDDTTLIDDTAPTPEVKGSDTRTVELRELIKERQATARKAKEAEAAKAEAEALRTKLAEAERDRDTYKDGHAAWTKHTTESAAKEADALKTRIAALPEADRKEIEGEIKDGLSPAQALRWLDRLDKAKGATQAADPAKPEHPTGGRTAAGTPAPDELTPEQKRWVAAKGLPASLSKATVETMMKNLR